MSFMNPVDMVDEDAADLQFPKVKQKTCQRNPNKFELARIDDKTKCATVFYSAQAFNSQLEDSADQDDIGGQHAARSTESTCATCRCMLREPYIKCSECLDIFLCLSCFARGREIGVHRNNHAYIIVRDDIQVFASETNWTARDERTLLQALRLHGYGNWDAVANALGQRHAAAEIRQHYHDYYFGGIFERLLGLQHHRNCYLPERMPYVFKMRSLEPPRHDDMGSMQFKINAGYRCARGDFDTPYDASSEGLLSVMIEPQSTAVEDELETESLDKELLEELQQALVRAYNNRLRERQRRYRIMREHGLIMPNRTVSWISKYVNAFRSDASCMRFLSLMQVCQPIEFDLLVESLRYYRQLQSRIDWLYDLRQHGVRTLYGGSLYAQLYKQRQHQQREYARQRQNDAHDWQQLVHNYEQNQNLEQLPQGSSSSRVYMLYPRRKASPMEISDLAGYSKLDAGERALCSVARVMPQAYLEYKNQLIAEQAKLGHLRLGDARRLIKIDVNKTRQIYDFMMENGHIRPHSYG